MTPPDNSPSPAAHTERQIVLLGGTKRRGVWRVPQRSLLISIVGGADLDMTQAEFSSSEVTVTWWSLLGGLTIIVPPGTKADISGFRLLGGRDIKIADGAPGGTTVHVVANTLVGGVKIRSA